MSSLITTVAGFEIRYYGVLLALAFIAAYFILKKLGNEEGIKAELTEDYLIYMMLGILIGARLFHVFFYNWAYFSQDFIKIFYVWQGGLASHGGIFGGALANYLFTKKHNLSFYKMSDLAVIPVALGAACVRVGNFTNAELVGKITNVSWATSFDGAQGTRHPVQLYQAASNFLLFIILATTRAKTKMQEGALTWIFLLLYGVTRFATEFFKDLPPYYSGLNLAQWASVTLVCISVYMLRKKYVIKETTSN